MRITYTIKSKEDLGEEALDTIREAILAQVQGVFDEKIGPHLEAQGRDLAPVSAERNFAPRVFGRVKVKPPGALGRESASGTPGDVLQRLRNYSPKERARFFQQAFGKSTRKKSVTQFFTGTGKNAGREPDELRISRSGAITGAFRHRPGNLRDSVKYVGSTRDGDTVTGVVRAHAPYSRAVHEGFTHRGGREHKGKETRIKGRPFLKMAAASIEEDLSNLG